MIRSLFLTLVQRTNQLYPLNDEQEKTLQNKLKNHFEDGNGIWVGDDKTPDFIEGVRGVVSRGS